MKALLLAVTAIALVAQPAAARHHRHHNHKTDQSFWQQELSKLEEENRQLEQEIQQIIAEQQTQPEQSTQAPVTAPDAAIGGSLPLASVTPPTLSPTLTTPPATPATTPQAASAAPAPSHPEPATSSPSPLADSAPAQQTAPTIAALPSPSLDDPAITSPPLSAFAECGKTVTDIVAHGQARGINIYPDDLLRAGAENVLNTFRGLNFLRVNISDLDTYNAAAMVPVVNALTAKGVIVNLEDHANNEHVILQGAALDRAAAWYRSMASAFKNNPNVIFETENEPDLTGGWSAANTMIGTIYQSVRSTGNNNLVLINPPWPPDGLDRAMLANMKDIAWDIHYYNNTSGFSTDFGTIVAALQNEVVSVAQVAAIPVVVGEYGIACCEGYDPAGMKVVQAVQQSGLSSTTWAWTSGDPNKPLLLNDAMGNPAAGLSPFGQSVANYIAGGPASKQCSPSIVTSSVVPQNNLSAALSMGAKQ